MSWEATQRIKVYTGQDNISTRKILHNFLGQKKSPSWTGSVIWPRSAKERHLSWHELKPVQPRGVALLLGPQGDTKSPQHQGKLPASASLQALPSRFQSDSPNPQPAQQSCAALHCSVMHQQPAMLTSNCSHLAPFSRPPLKTFLTSALSP